MKEFMLVFAIPVVWAVWELVSLERHRRRTHRPPLDDTTPSAGSAPPDTEKDR